jgi:acetylornithine deacetylase/succinyl-diaminopimelate desuccinylase-like protein
MDSVAGHLKSNRKQYLRELKEILRIPSLSVEPKGAKAMQKAADWVCRRLRSAGCQTAEIHETDGHPLVYGESLEAPGAPTLLVYGHYDVQPVEPLDLWDKPPFKPTVVGKRIYARGASDNKGQFLVHINAFEALRAVHDKCPINVKFLIEGEEEIGSPNLTPFIRKNKRKLACDAVVISDNAMFDKNVPSLCYGLRGCAFIEITVKGTKRDLHSGTFGGTVINPANALAQIIASLKDARGRITVTGFYDSVKRGSVTERSAFTALPASSREYRASIGAPELFGEDGYTNLERRWTRPTLDVNGIWSGYTGAGTKTVIPAEAHAKLSMRLVPNQSSKEISYKVSAYLKKLAPKAVKIQVRTIKGAEPWTCSKENFALQAASRALNRAFGTPPVFIRDGGSIPVVASFDRLLKAPIVLMGFGLHDDNLHAPNEKLELNQFHRGMDAAAFLMEELQNKRKKKRTI